MTENPLPYSYETFNETFITLVKGVHSVCYAIWNV